MNEWINGWIVFTTEHVSGAERGASEERSVQNIVGARSGFLSKGWSDRSVSLRFRSDTAHTTSMHKSTLNSPVPSTINKTISLYFKNRLLWRSILILVRYSSNESSLNISKTKPTGHRLQVHNSCQKNRW